jgi:hypothetical protein
VTTVTVSGTAAHADTVTFDGVIIALAHGDTAAQTAAKIAAGVYTNYTVSAAGAVLTVTNKSTGNPANLTAGAFTFTDGLATGQTAGAVATTVQGVTAAGAVAATAEAQNMTVAGTATGPVAFLGINVAGTNVGSTPAQVVTAIIADKANIIAAWNAANPSRELADIVDDGSGTGLDLTYATTEGNVAPMAGSVSNGIGFGNATTDVEGALATPAVAAVAEQFTLTLTGPAVGADTIAFNGTTINTIVDGDSASAIATKVAAGVYADWTAAATGNVVTFTAKVAQAQADTVIGGFTFTDVTVSGT